jgi:hypothetical protein
MSPKTESSRVGRPALALSDENYNPKIHQGLYAPAPE